MPLVNVPLSGQTLGETQAPINSNFNTISTVFTADHVDYTAPGAGFHNTITFPLTNPYTAPVTNATVAIPGFAANQVGLYSAPTVSPVPVSNANAPMLSTQDIWLQRGEATLGNQPIPITAYNFSTSASGWTYLPSGLLMQWGVGTVSQNSLNVSVVYPIPYTSIYPSPMITPNGNGFPAGTFLTAQGVSKTGFTAQSSSNQTSSVAVTRFSWMSMGI